MNHLPCEILQLVASSLLPRYQCRFALTSRQNYDCLYSPLLHWHAQKAAVPAPKYKCLEYNKYVQISLREFNKQMVMYDHSFDSLEIINFTQERVITIDYIYKYVSYENVLDHHYMIDLWRSPVRSKMLQKCCKYMNINSLRTYISLQHPLASLPPSILYDIEHRLENADLDNLIKSSRGLSVIYLGRY